MDGRNYRCGSALVQEIVCQAIPNPDFGKTTKAKDTNGTDSRTDDTTMDNGGPDASSDDTGQEKPTK